MAFVSLPLVPIAVILATAVSPWLLALALVPWALLLVPYLRIRGWTGDRNRSIEEELPFFAIRASIFQSAGRDMYDALVSTIGSETYDQIERDAAITRRNTSYFRMGPLEGLEELGRSNPNPKFRSLLLGYSSEWRSGGDATRYLERKTADYLKDAEDRWKRYTGSVTFSGELSVMMFFFIPIFLMVILFLDPPLGARFAEISIIFAFPLLAAGTYALIRHTQPKNFDELEGSLPLAAVLALAAGLLTFPLPAWACASAIIAAGAFGYGIPVILQRREMGALEAALPEFIRDATEFQKMGYDLTKAVVKISEENTYNPSFDRLLGFVARQVAAGNRISEARTHTRSWITRTAFSHLGEIAESGAYQARSLELLADYVSATLRTRHEVRSSMRLYLGLALLAPVALGALAGLMGGFLGSMSTYQVTGISTGIALETGASAVIGYGYALVFASAIILPWLASYATYFTPKNTVWVAVGVALGAIGMSLAGPIAGGASALLG